MNILIEIFAITITVIIGIIIGIAKIAYDILKFFFILALVLTGIAFIVDIFD